MTKGPFDERDAKHLDASGGSTAELQDAVNLRRLALGEPWWRTVLLADPSQECDLVAEERLRPLGRLGFFRKCAEAYEQHLGMLIPSAERDWLARATGKVWTFLERADWHVMLVPSDSSAADSLHSKWPLDSLRKPPRRGYTKP